MLLVEMGRAMELKRKIRHKSSENCPQDLPVGGSSVTEARGLSREAIFSASKVCTESLDILERNIGVRKARAPIRRGKRTSIIGLGSLR